MKSSKHFVLGIVALGGLACLLPAMRARVPATIPFKDHRLKFELNASAGDLGIQGFIDAEPWDHVMIEAPNGRKIYDVKGKGNLESLGMTEGFWESNEPNFADMSRDEILALFPAGTYTFIGTTIEGDKLSSTAVLTHDLPDGPVIVSPPDDSLQDPANTVVDWDPVTTPAGIQIVEYEVIVEQVSPHRELSVHVAGTVTSMTVPPEFMEPGQDYIFEVLAIEVSGNQTITEGSFATQ